MRRRRREGGRLGEGAGDDGGRGEAERREHRPVEAAEVGEAEPGVGGRQERWSDWRHARGGGRAEERRPEYPRRYRDALGGENELRHVVDDVVAQVLLLNRLLVFDGGRGSASIAHCIAALRDRVAARRFHVGGRDSGSDYGRVLPDRGRTKSWEERGGRRKQGRNRR